MTTGCPPPREAEPAEIEEREDDLERLIRDGAPDEEIGDATFAAMRHLLDIEHLHMAAWHACRYESYWDVARKLAVLESFHQQGSDAFAITLCHRWKLSALCFAQKRQLFTELFPKLPPRNDKKEPS
jgi:hypothetical protein